MVADNRAIPAHLHVPRGIVARKLTPERQKLRLDAIRIRQELGWSIRVIAGHLRVPKSDIHYWLSNNGTHAPSHNTTPLPPNNIYCMDCLNGLRQLPHDSVDLVFADPPYNIRVDYYLPEDKRVCTRCAAKGEGDKSRREKQAKLI